MCLSEVGIGYSQVSVTKSRKYGEKQKYGKRKILAMNDYPLDPTSAKNLTPRRLEQEVSAKKKSNILPAENESFKSVLKGVVDNKTGGTSEIRHELVSKLKGSLADGSYEVKAKELAEKMIQKIRENKTRNII